MNSRQPHRQAGRLWFGLNLSQFLRAELQDFPGRRVAAFRLFCVTLTIALVSQSLHMPPLGALAILVSLSYDPYANAGQSLAFGVRQLGFLIVTTLASVFALIVSGNDAWLLLPLSFLIMAIALFHARLIAWPTGIALWYSIAVLYSPASPDENIYHALWNIPIIGVLAIGAWTVTHLTIKPQDPLKLLRANICEQLAAVESIINRRLADSGAASRQPSIAKSPAAGNFGKTLGLLANTELLHPSVHKRHDTYLALLLEIDGLQQLAIWLDQVLTVEYRALAMSPEKLKVYLALHSACVQLRQGLQTSRDVSAQITALLDDTVLHNYTPASHPSLLTALWRALQRIADAMQALHTAPLPPDANPPTSPTAANEKSGWLPAWFGYPFWASHADSLQYGIKFSLGAIICTLIIQSLAWPDLNTAIPTCLVAAQTSLGADYRLSLLRLSGAALGGLCAYFYVLVLQSQLDSIAGFTVATLPFWAIAAWIAAGSERIAYLGRQLGFSFALFVLHDFGPVIDLYLPRDRVIGILLGIIVMGVLDYALWPRRSIVLARHHCRDALQTLAKFTTRLPEAGLLLKPALPLRLAAEKDLAISQDLVMHALLEPDAAISYRVNERTAISGIIKDAGNLSGLLQVRRRYRLLSGAQFHNFPEQLQSLSQTFDAALAGELETAALTLEDQHPHMPIKAADVHAELKQSYTDFHRIDSLPDDLSMEWAMRFRLDQQIMELVAQIRKNALAAVSHHLN